MTPDSRRWLADSDTRGSAASLEEDYGNWWYRLVLLKQREQHRLIISECPMRLKGLSVSSPHEKALLFQADFGPLEGALIKGGCGPSISFWVRRTAFRQRSRS